MHLLSEQSRLDVVYWTVWFVLKCMLDWVVVTGQDFVGYWTRSGSRQILSQASALDLL